MHFSWKRKQQQQQKPYCYHVANCIQCMLCLIHWSRKKKFYTVSQWTLNKTLFYRCINCASEEMAVVEHYIKVNTVTFCHLNINYQCRDCAKEAKQKITSNLIRKSFVCNQPSQLSVHFNSIADQYYAFRVIKCWRKSGK